jgi:hypothetical protein
VGTKLFSTYLAAKEIVEYRQYLPLGWVGKVFNVPQILNLPCSNVPQKYVKTMENLGPYTLLHYVFNKKVYLTVFMLHASNDRYAVKNICFWRIMYCHFFSKCTENRKLQYLKYVFKKNLKRTLLFDMCLTVFFYSKYSIIVNLKRNLLFDMCLIVIFYSKYTNKFFVGYAWR